MNQRRLNLFGATVLLWMVQIALMPGLRAQTTHDITVGDNFLSPADVTIQKGETVRWINSGEDSGGGYGGGYGGGTGGGNTHHLVADDGSWMSPSASSFTFSHTFNSSGSVPYHCTIHASMKGTITVQAAPAGFQINAGLNDSWFNPATNGQGFFITVFPDIKMMFLAWFTYDTERPPAGVSAILGEPGHRWLTAFGPYSGDTATLDVELTQGGVFDSAAPAVTQSPDGTIEVIFSGCNAGMVNYNIPSAAVSGQIPIERIALDNVPHCETLAAP